MLKKIAFLVKRADLTDEQFRQHWRERHGFVVSRTPGYSEYRTEYVQNHVIDGTAIGEAFAWSGMAEFILPGDSPNEDTFASTAAYRDRIAVDERLFIDMDATISMTVDAQSAAEGRSSTKIVVVASPGARGAVAPRALAHEVLSAPTTPEGAVVGWLVNSVLPGSFRLPGGRATDEPPIDAVHEIWLADSVDPLAATAALAEGLAPHLSMARTFSFRAQEYVFFSDGAARIPDGLELPEDLA